MSLAATRTRHLYKTGQGNSLQDHLAPAEEARVVWKMDGAWDVNAAFHTVPIELELAWEACILTVPIIGARLALGDWEKPHQWFLQASE